MNWAQFILICSFLYIYINMHNNVGKNGSKNNKNQSQKEQLMPQLANNLINDVYDNFLKEDINGRQFEELFEEIAELIKLDQKERGFGMLEINNFVDDCQEVLLIGFRQELSNFDDFQFDQSSPLLMLTQQFLYDRAKRQTKEKIQIEQDFPTLGGSSNNSKYKNQISIIEKIQRQQKKKKDEGYLFKPSNVILPHFAQQKSNNYSIFNVDNKLKSQKDLESLHKEFLDFPIIDLKFVYRAFVGDINVCREFLIKYYGFTRNNQKKPENTKSNKSKQSSVHSKRIYNKVRKEQIDEQLKHLSYEQIRGELDHLYKLKQAFQLMKMRIKNSKQRTQLDRIILQKQPIINKLSNASRVLLVEKMAKSNPLYVDLHGFRQEEAEKVLETIEEMVRQEFDRGSEKVKTKKMKNYYSALLTVITGKGLHSKGMRSVLKPTIIKWCNYRKLNYEEDADHIKIQLQLTLP